jgi:GDPmannose 4,6-dehydratase
VSKKRALITGVSGQDGIFLTKYLAGKNYDVFGLSRQSISDFRRTFPFPQQLVRYFKADIQDTQLINQIISDLLPDEIYNFAGMSFVPDSFTEPLGCMQSTATPILNILEHIKSHQNLQKIRIYQASSSEIFGDSNEFPQSIFSSKKPRTPYGAAKLFAHNISEIYRNQYGIYVSCGITYNHESEYRGRDYVTRKISYELARIKLGLQKNLILGNLKSQRDWGYAGDYVKAMHASLQTDVSGSYIIATGKLHSVDEFLNAALESIDLLDQKENIIEMNLVSSRPQEQTPLVGNPEETFKLLGWRPEKTITQIAEIMTNFDLKCMKK